MRSGGAASLPRSTRARGADLVRVLTGRLRGGGLRIARPYQSGGARGKCHREKSRPLSGYSEMVRRCERAANICRSTAGARQMIGPGMLQMAAKTSPDHIAAGVHDRSASAMTPIQVNQRNSGRARLIALTLSSRSLRNFAWNCLAAAQLDKLHVELF